MALKVAGASDPEKEVTEKSFRTFFFFFLDEIIILVSVLLFLMYCVMSFSLAGSSGLGRSLNRLTASKRTFLTNQTWSTLRRF